MDSVRENKKPSIGEIEMKIIRSKSLRSVEAFVSVSNEIKSVEATMCSVSGCASTPHIKIRIKRNDYLLCSPHMKAIADSSRKTKTPAQTGES